MGILHLTIICFCFIQSDKVEGCIHRILNIVLVCKYIKIVTESCLIKLKIGIIFKLCQNVVENNIA